MPIDLPGASSTGLPDLPPVSLSASRQWIGSFRKHFEDWVLAPIHRLAPSDDARVAFILIACAIDYLAGFWWGKSTEGKVKLAYTGFIDAFFPSGKYDAEGIYDSLRNGLVHMYTIKGKKYALTHNHPELHLKSDKKAQIILNAADLEADLLVAANAYFDAASASEELASKAHDRYSRDGFLGVSPLEMP